MSFLLKNSRFLGFGLFLAFMSSIGQTYFIGVYRVPIAEEYGLSNSDFGFYYLLITIVSAVGLNRLGHVIDRTGLLPYSLTLVFAAAIACFAMGFTSAFWMVVVCLMAVRLLGQGLLTHAAMTSMSRYFDRRRGVAVAIAGLGFPIGQAILPPVAVLLMSDYAWRTGWVVFGVGLALVGAPIVAWLLKGHAVRHQQWQEREAAVSQSEAANDGQHKRRRDVLADKRFYLMLPALLAGPFWITAVFFFAAEMGAHAGMGLEGYTRFYWLYASGSVMAPFVGGLLVDRFGGQRLIPFYPPVIGAALLSILVWPSAQGVTLFMLLMGLGAGITLPINNAIWAELYGTKYLGEIKSLSTSIAVLSTALAPYTVGLLLDSGQLLTDILLFGGLFCFGAATLVLPVAMGKRS